MKNMSRKKKTKIDVTTITSAERFQQEKPRYNAYQCGIGAWRDKRRPNRASRKADARREVEKEISK